MNRGRNSVTSWSLGGALIVLLLAAFPGCDDEDTTGPTPTGSGTPTASTGGGGTGGTAGGGTGGTAGTGGGTGCTPDDTQDCYEGPTGTEGVGICYGGTQTCTAQGTWGACQGQQLPETEDCTAAEDEDCDGVACSEHIFSSMYGNTLDSFVWDVATDGAGNIAIAGEYTGGSFNLGGSDLPAPNATETNLFVALYNSSGVHQWSVGIGTTDASQAGRALAFDSNGDLIVTGTCEGAGGAVDFGGSAGDAYCWQTDVFVAKFAGNNGAAQWVRTWGTMSTTGFREPRDIALDGNDNIIIVGDHNGVGPCADPNGFGAFVRKLNPNGTTTDWTNCYDANSSDLVDSVAIDSTNAIIIGGYFHDQIILDQTLTSPSGDRYAFLAKLNAGGTPQWSWNFGDGSTSVAQRVTGLAVDGSDAIAVTGYFGGSLELDGSTSITGTGTAIDGYVAKYSGAGVYDWHLHIDDATGDAEQRPDALAVDSQGNVVIGGAFYGTVDFGAGNVAADGADMFLLKLNGTAGSYLWHKHFGVAGFTYTEEIISGVAIGTNDMVVATGVASGDTDFGSGTALSHAGGTDVFLAAYQP